MFQYVLKRLLYFIPTLFVISLFTFMLSTIAPGDPVELKLQGGMQSGTSGQRADQLADEEAYLEQSKKLGLDLPLFYFSITSAAYPDTLYKIPKKRERKMLDRMIAKYGNWPQIETYFHSIKDLEIALFQVETDSTNYERVRVVRENCNELYRIPFDEEIVVLLAQIDSNARVESRIMHYEVDTLQQGDSVTYRYHDTTYVTKNTMAAVVPYVEDLLKAYKEVKAKATPGKGYMPAIHWYGYRNQYHRWLFGDRPWSQDKEEIAQEKITTDGNLKQESTYVVEDSGYYKIKIKGKNTQPLEGGSSGSVTYSVIVDQVELQVATSEDPKQSFVVDRVNRFVPGDTVQIVFNTQGKDLSYTLEIDRLLDYDPNNTAGGFVRWDFGESYLDGRPVSSILGDAIIWTLKLNAIVFFFVYLLSIPVGVGMGYYRGRGFDRISTIILFILYSLPSFWIATMLQTFLTTDAYQLNWFPTYGVGTGAHLVLPVFCLVYGGVAFISRQMRGGVVNVINQDYIRTARAKGLGELTVVGKHTVRNSLIPIITLFASFLPFMISGSVIIEIIFQIPGMGKESYGAVVARNYPVLFTVLMFSAILTMLGVLISDILYALVDPRISFSKKS